jgi:hypothetical protein
MHNVSPVLSKGNDDNTPPSPAPNMSNRSMISKSKSEYSTKADGLLHCQKPLEMQ